MLKKNYYYTLLVNNSKNLFSIFGLVLSKLSQVAIQLILVRLLSGEDYSLFYYYYSVIIGLSSFVGEGFGLVASRHISTMNREENKEPSNELYSLLAAGLWISLLPAVLGSLIYIFFSDGTASVFLLQVMIIYVMLFSFSSILQYITIAIGERVYLAKTQIFYSFTLVLLSSLGAYYLGWVAALSGSLISVVLLNILLIKKSLSLSKLLKYFVTNLKTNFYFLKKALPICAANVLGGPVHVYCLSLLKLSTQDRPTEVGIFGISFVTYTLLLFLPGALGQFLVPWLLKNKNLDILSSFKLVKKIYFIFGLILLCGIIIINLSGLFKILSPNFVHSQKTIILLSFSGFIAGFCALYSILLNALYRSTYFLLSTIFYGFSYILLTYIFVKVLNMGAVGLSLAIMFSSIGQLLVLLYLKARVLKELKEPQ